MVQYQGGREVQPGGILQYFEDLNRAPNTEIGPKDFFEMVSNLCPAAAWRRALTTRTCPVCFLLLVMLFASLIGCEVLDYGLLETEETITSGQLRDNWNRFIVYHRPNAGLVYKLKNNKNIKLPGKWVEVAGEKEVIDKKALYQTDVRRILGQDEILYGYLVLAYGDSAFIRIVNANTVELIYNHKMQQTGR